MQRMRERGDVTKLVHPGSPGEQFRGESQLIHTEPRRVGRPWVRIGEPPAVGSRRLTEEYIVLTGGTLMSTHDAGYFRQRRRSQGISEREPFSAQRFQQRATELQRLEQLPWPKNLFGEPATIRTLVEDLADAAENTDEACWCGCGQEHKQNVTQTRRNPYGRGFDVIYFRSEACKIRWNQERRRAGPVTSLDSGRNGNGAAGEIGDCEPPAASRPNPDDEAPY